MIDLKPCPFCPDGGEIIFKDGYQDEEGSWHSGYVRCEKCGTMKMSVSLSNFLGTYRHGFVSDETAHECSLTAIERWNTRHERTCRVERMELDEFGRHFYLSCGHMQMTHNTSALPYCPICGARVKEDTDE